MKRRYTIQNILLTVLWIIIGTGTVVLLVAAIQKKDGQHCSGVYINIKGVSNNFFVDKKDIQNTIRSISGGNIIGRPVGSVDLKAIEHALQKNVWIKNAQLFFDNNEKLQVNVLEREPIARVFTRTGNTFYLDSSGTMLPLSDKFSARLPVFTNFPSDKKVLLHADSMLLREILAVSAAIHADSFLMAMIEQVDITEQRVFEMIPKFGNTIIVFGDGKDVHEKFSKLQLFYKEVMIKAGWNKYNAINVQYKNQVVASRKGAVDVRADSIRTLQLMKAIAENAERLSADSLQAILPDNEQNTTNSNLIQHSLEREDNSAVSGTIEETGSKKVDDKAQAPVAVPVSSTKLKLSDVPKAEAKPSRQVTPGSSPVNKRQATGPKPAEVKKPKVVMPKALPKSPAVKKPANDY